MSGIEFWEVAVPKSHFMPPLAYFRLCWVLLSEEFILFFELLFWGDLDLFPVLYVREMAFSLYLIVFETYYVVNFSSDA